MVEAKAVGGPVRYMVCHAYGDPSFDVNEPTTGVSFTSGLYLLPHPTTTTQPQPLNLRGECYYNHVDAIVPPYLTFMLKQTPPCKM